jgi:hypothetical protein
MNDELKKRAERLGINMDELNKATEKFLLSLNDNELKMLISSLMDNQCCNNNCGCF